MDKELKSLTGIRGIAALWVVLLHYIEPLNIGNDLYISKLFSNGIIAVDMFFLLSSFVMCLAYSDEFKETISIHSYNSFIKKRFARIYPAYFFWVFMFLSFEFIKLDFNYTKILVNLLLIQNLFNDSVIAGIFWSLSSEWILYIVFPFLYFILHKTRVRYINLLLILTCLVGLYSLPSINNYFIDFNKGLYSAPPDGFIGVVTGFNSIIRCFFSYVIGINLFLLIKNYNPITFTWVRLLKYFIILGMFVIFYFGRSAETYVLLIISSIILISSIYLSNKEVDSFFASKIVYFLGKISYSIYLCHMFILVLISVLFKKLFTFQDYPNIQSFLVLVSLTLLIPVSYLSYKFLEIKAGAFLKSKLSINPSKVNNIETQIRQSV
ncbi:acyltransferase [Sporocytophaga myxococcoides]|uniref:Acyltransferase n=1 Tax=Sporocytophaga myxococcoides TaxID=153721 RepID=A0A098LC76_9BACT|nr:acyltransferase [Sporocytophaga myxococcoides]GAL84052.1 acyltransferase [Sporocytophaga myxococcoides]